MTRQDLNARALDSPMRIPQASNTSLASSLKHSKSTLKRVASDHTVFQLSSVVSKTDKLRSSKQNPQVLSLNGKPTQWAKSQKNFANSSKKSTRVASPKPKQSVLVFKPSLKWLKARSRSNWLSSNQTTSIVLCQLRKSKQS